MRLIESWRSASVAAFDVGGWVWSAASGSAGADRSIAGWRSRLTRSGISITGMTAAGISGRLTPSATCRRVAGGVGLGVSRGRGDS